MRTFYGSVLRRSDVGQNGFPEGLREQEFEVDRSLRLACFNTAKLRYPDLDLGDFPYGDSSNAEVTACDSPEAEVSDCNADGGQAGGSDNGAVTDGDVDENAAADVDGAVSPETIRLADEIAAVDLAGGAAVASEIVPEEIAEKPKYRPSPSFADKMLRADESIKDRYDELKNYALRFKKLKSRISKKFDSINRGRLQFVKLSVSGKTLKLYLNMDVHDTDPKFHCKNMIDKKTYVTVPVLIRIKSARAVRYAKILIDQCASMHGLVENKKFVEVDAIAIVEAVKSQAE